MINLKLGKIFDFHTKTWLIYLAMITIQWNKHTLPTYILILISLKCYIREHINSKKVMTEIKLKN